MSSYEIVFCVSLVFLVVAFAVLYGYEDVVYHKYGFELPEDVKNKRRKCKVIGVILFIVGALSCGYAVAGYFDTTIKPRYNKLNRDYITDIKNSITKLDEYPDYIISSALEQNDSVLTSIVVSHNDDSYTEYSVDADGNLGTLEYASAVSMQYALSDWLTADGKNYIVSGDSNGSEILYSMPLNYGERLKDRKFMYVNDLLEGTKEISRYDDITMDILGVTQQFKTYQLKVDSEVVKKILSTPTYGVYESIEEDDGTNENVRKLCEEYTKELEFALVYSDANVLVGIDQSGCLRYMCLEVGGIGQRMYLTNVVVDLQNINVREQPDFTSAVDFASSLQEVADYVASFDSYEDAVESLNASGGLNDTSATESLDIPDESVSANDVTETGNNDEDIKGED